jgi:16S rRNA processing protein RimM
MKASDPTSFLVIGEITKPHGIRGEVRVKPHTDLPERFTWLDTVFLGQKDPQQVVVEGVRLHKGMILLKLAGYDFRDQAEALRGQWLQVPESEAIPLEDGEYFLYQLEGAGVFTVAGRFLGHIVELIETGANRVFVVRGDAGDLLIPDIKDVIREIDLENSRLMIEPLPGLLPE